MPTAIVLFLMNDKSNIYNTRTSFSITKLNGPM